MECVFDQGPTLEPGLMRCCHTPCGARLIDHHVNISNKLLLDIRKYIKKYYIVSIVAFQWTRVYLCVARVADYCYSLSVLLFISFFEFS